MCMGSAAKVCLQQSEYNITAAHRQQHNCESSFQNDHTLTKWKQNFCSLSVADTPFYCPHISKCFVLKQIMLYVLQGHDFSNFSTISGLSPSSVIHTYLHPHSVSQLLKLAWLMEPECPPVTNSRLHPNARIKEMSL